MNESLASKCLQYLGQKLQYIDENRKLQTRILDNVFIDPRTNSYVASFRYGILKRLTLNSKWVPLTDVLLPELQSPEMGKKKYNNGFNQSSGGLELSPSQTRSSFRLYGDVYNVATGNKFKTKADDDVVWIKYSNIDDECIGTVIVTAERESVMGVLILVAIVKLEKMPTEVNGFIPPGHINYLHGVKNTFVVPENELLKLDEWITKSSEAERKNKENEWNTVGNKKKRMTGVDPPKTVNYGSTSHLLQSRLPYSLKNDDDYQNESGQRFLPNADGRLKKTKLQHPQLAKPFDEVEVAGSYEEQNFPESENQWQTSLDKLNFFETIKQKKGSGMGVQGHDNSCYIDASLFALFSFSHALDKFIVTEENSSEDSDSGSQLKTVLKNNIVFQMRHAAYFVPKQHIQKMRNIFGQVFSTGYLSRFMDVEDFLGDFFKLLDAPPFLHYDNGEADYIHQIALPFNWTRRQHKPYLSLQALLENSFKAFQVKLGRITDDIFIVKLPVSDGVLIPCNGVIPDLTLDFTKVIGDSSNHHGDDNAKMTLNSVICLQHHHFVAWVRTGKTVGSPWVYMDSRPTTQMPYVCYLPDVDAIIQNALEELNSEEDVCRIGSYEPQCENYFLFRHAYVCIYVKH